VAGGAKLNRTLIALAVALLVAAAAAKTPTGKPPVPAGAPTSGFGVALLSDGIDYTRPGIAAKLARDGEGEIIGWDVVDNDRRPYLRGGAATRLVEIASTLIVPYRLANVDGVTSVMAAMRDILFIIPAGDDGTELEIDVRAGNILVVTALATLGAPSQPNGGGAGVDLVIAPETATREAPLGASVPSTSFDAAMLAAGLFACVDLKAATSPADVKRALVARAQQGPKGQPPMISPCR
jgi:hypothetical protein